MREIKFIVLHCSATKEGQNFQASDIDRFHRQRGFQKIGYHYLVTLEGTIQKGREEIETGAHVRGHNSNSIGVCYIGGLDGKGNPKDTRTASQKKALLSLLSHLKNKYPRAIIQGHRDFPGVRKACPCFDAKKEYQNL